MTERTCGECNVCCKWLRIEGQRPDIDHPSGTPCSHSTAHGCDIYAERPPLCSSYRCAWITGRGDENLRPDKAGFVINLAAQRSDGKGESLYDPPTITSWTEEGALRAEGARNAFMACSAWAEFEQTKHLLHTVASSRQPDGKWLTKHVPLPEPEPEKPHLRLVEPEEK